MSWASVCVLLPVCLSCCAQDSWYTTFEIAEGQLSGAPEMVSFSFAELSSVSATELSFSLLQNSLYTSLKETTFILLEGIPDVSLSSDISFSIAQFSFSDVPPNLTSYHTSSAPLLICPITLTLLFLLL